MRHRGIIVFVDEAGLCERRFRARTRAVRGQTRILKYRFSWNLMSVMAIDYTSRSRGHDHIMFAADVIERRVRGFAEGRGTKALGAVIEDRGCALAQSALVNIDMSRAFITDSGARAPHTPLTFGVFPFIWHANATVDCTRRLEQRTDRSLNGPGGLLLEGCSRLIPGGGLLDVPRPSTRGPRAQANQRQSADDRSPVDPLRALDMRTHEGGRYARPTSPQRPSYLGSHSLDKRLLRSAQRTVPARKASRRLVREFVDDLLGHLTHCRQTQFALHQRFIPSFT